MKPTILYICPDTSLGGSTRSLMNLIEAIKDEVTPIVLLPSTGLAHEWFVEHNIECIVYPYILLHQLPASISWKKFIRRPWRQPLIKHIRVDAKCIRYVSRQLKGRKIDIVHSNFSPVTIGVGLSKVLHAKHVWHVREFNDLDFHFEFYFKMSCLSWLLNRADARVAISTALYKHLHLQQQNTWIIANPICKQSDACYIPLKEKYVLFSSYFLKETKGTRVAIIAFAKSGVAQQGMKLKLMGGCEESYYASLMETIKEYSVENAVEFIPCQKDVKPYFSHATAYIMASECEGLGRVTAEAMFFGCPVIAHATGGTLDLVKDGETGYLYNTIDECAALLKKVCSENQEPLILRAQEFAVNNLSQEVYGPKIMEVYNKVMN